MRGSPITLITADSREALRGIPPETMDAIITDPPYGDFQNAPSGGRETDDWAEWDGTGVTFDPEIWKQMLRAAKPGALLLAFNTPRIVHRMATAIEAAGWEIRDGIVWRYRTGKPHSRRHLKPGWESIVVGRKALAEKTVEANIAKWGVGGFFPEAYRDQDPDERWPENVMEVAKPSPREKEGNKHPTVKPVELMRRLIRVSTRPGGIVLDPFLGSGTTAVAAVLEGRGCVGIEGVPRFVQLAQRRVDDAESYVVGDYR